MRTKGIERPRVFAGTGPGAKPAVEGWHMTLKDVFQKETPGDGPGYWRMLGGLLRRRLARLREYATQLELKGVDEHSSHRIYEECMREGLIPRYLPEKAPGTGAFWGAFLARGQENLPPGLLAGVHRHCGRQVYYHQLVAEVAGMRDRKVPEPADEQVANAVWSEIETLAETADLSGARVEPVFLSAALRVALDGRAGLSLPEAYCLAFRAGLGAARGVADFTRANFDEIERLASFGTPEAWGAGFEPGVFASGRAGAAIQAMSQWRRHLAARPGLAGTPEGAAVLKMFSQQLPGVPKPSMLGTLLSRSVFWERILDDGKLRATLAGYAGTSGLVTDYLRGRNMTECLESGFARRVREIFEAVNAHGRGFMDFEPDFGSLAARNEAFLQAFAHAVASHLDDVSRAGDSLGKSLPEAFTEWNALPRDAMEYHAGENLDVSRRLFDSVKTRLAERLPGLDLERLGLDYAACLRPGQPGGRGFSDWLARAWVLTGSFYRQVVAPDATDVGMKAWLLQELRAAPNVRESLYRKYHALGLYDRWMVAVTAVCGPGELGISDGLLAAPGWLRKSTRDFLQGLAQARYITGEGAAMFARPDAAVASRLHHQYAELAGWLEPVPMPGLAVGLKEGLARQLGTWLRQVTLQELMAAKQLEGAPAALAREARWFTVVFNLANHVETMMAQVDAACRHFELERQISSGPVAREPESADPEEILSETEILSR
ncbi:hypothetical protein AW736_02205 [Termitidicoccus mucosus]|uniref:Uncharacterized protein n=1 Tax=Termitidicoccus mucosus TaxID=1184151 RepID=A0A178IP44_9BACT|nr:hypothetical protein AW736_02205 [Opitutaceae bacterium TSB47]